MKKEKQCILCRDAWITYTKYCDVTYKQYQKFIKNHKHIYNESEKKK